MKILIRSAVMLLLSTCLLPAYAGGKTATASFQVSFVIQESCVIDSATHKATVNCQFGAPYKLSYSGNPAMVPTIPTIPTIPAAALQQRSGDLLTVTF